MADPGPVGLVASIQRLGRTLVGTLQNRFELFIIELQEERYRLLELLLMAGAAVILGVLALVLFSGVVIFVFPADYRIYVAAGLGLAYGAGVLMLVRHIRARLRDEPFAETVAEIKKDCECLIPPR